MTPVKTLGERIADALIEDGLLTVEQVEELLEKQKKEGTRFIKLVVEKAYVTENDLVVAMGRVLNTPPVNVNRLMVPPDLADLVPRDIANNYKVLPVARLGNRLFLAMADPLNVLAVDDVKRMTKLDVSPMIASEKAILDRLANLDTSRTGTMEDIIQDAAKKADWRRGPVQVTEDSPTRARISLTCISFRMAEPLLAVFTDSSPAMKSI